MIPLGIFSSRDFTVANVYTLLLYAALTGTLFYVPFNLINVQHYTPLAAGASLLPVILLMFVSSHWSGALVTRIGARIPLTVGALIAGAGFALFGFTGIGGSYWTTFFPAALLLGMGTSTFVAPLTTTVMNSAPSAHAGSASGINNAISRVGGLLAIALLGIVIVAATRHALAFEVSPEALLTGHIPANTPARIARTIEQAYVIGFRDAMLAGAALAWLSAAVAAACLSRTKISRA